MEGHEELIEFYKDRYSKNFYSVNLALGLRKKNLQSEANIANLLAKPFYDKQIPAKTLVDTIEEYRASGYQDFLMDLGFFVYSSHTPYTDDRSIECVADDFLQPSKGLFLNLLRAASPHEKTIVQHLKETTAYRIRDRGSANNCAIIRNALDVIQKSKELGVSHLIFDHIEEFKYSASPYLGGLSGYLKIAPHVPVETHSTLRRSESVKYLRDDTAELIVQKLSGLSAGEVEEKICILDSIRTDRRVFLELAKELSQEEAVLLNNLHELWPPYPAELREFANNQFSKLIESEIPIETLIANLDNLYNDKPLLPQFTSLGKQMTFDEEEPVLFIHRPNFGEDDEDFRDSIVEHLSMFNAQPVRVGNCFSTDGTYPVVESCDVLTSVLNPKQKTIHLFKEDNEALKGTKLHRYADRSNILILPPKETVELCSDKVAFYEAMDWMDMPIPPTEIVSFKQMPVNGWDYVHNSNAKSSLMEFLEKHPGKYICKQAKSAGGHLQKITDDPQEVLRYVRSSRMKKGKKESILRQPAIVQSFIEGPLACIDFSTYKGELVTSLLRESKKMASSALISVSKISFSQKYHNFAEQITKHIDFGTSYVSADIIQSKKGDYLLEVNARNPGGELASIPVLQALCHMLCGDSKEEALGKTSFQPGIKRRNGRSVKKLGPEAPLSYWMQNPHYGKIYEVIRRSRQRF